MFQISPKHFYSEKNYCQNFGEFDTKCWKYFGNFYNSFFSKKDIKFPFFAQKSNKKIYFIILKNIGIILRELETQMSFLAMGPPKNTEQYINNSGDSNLADEVED
jgi:hypothetical protein